MIFRLFGRKEKKNGKFEEPIRVSLCSLDIDSGAVGFKLAPVIAVTSASS